MQRGDDVSQMVRRAYLYFRRTPFGSPQMTILSRQSFTCACCGAQSEGTVLCSTNAFGSMDLDMRPPPMKRDTLNQQIQQCPDCGYCSPDLGDAEGIDNGMVHRSDYQAILANESYPALARRFLACAHLAKVAGNHRLTMWATLRAAWVCDDGGAAYAHESAQCRDEAGRALDRLHAQGGSFANDLQSDEILRLDLLRRARRFEEAIAAATQLRKTSLPDVLDKIAAFQALQAAKQRGDCFTVDVALK